MFCVWNSPAFDRGLTYAQAGGMAIAASDELRAENATQLLREGAWVLGLRAYLPKVSFAIGEDDRLSMLNADSFSKSMSVTADQLVWDGGRTSVSRSLEAAEIALARQTLERKARDIAEAAVAAYRSVLSAREMTSIKESGLESLREQRRIMEVELASGLARADELAEADIAVGSAEIEALDAKMNEREACLAFAGALSLEVLPPLAERVETERRAVLLDETAVKAAIDAARVANADLVASRLSIVKKEAEARQASASWAPTVRLTASARVSGDRYPLTRSAWNVGLNIDFSGPFLSGSASTGAGREPPYDSSANASAKVEPLSDPASALSARSAAVALSLERERYAKAVVLMDRTITAAAQKYALLDKRTSLARASVALAKRKLELMTLNTEMGRATRIEAMEARAEVAAAEASLVSSATSLIEGERALERLMDLGPNALADFVERIGRRANER
ncbi:MAG: TolC family protein [Treponemataceae bacterium]